MAVSQAQTFSLMPKTAMAASWKLEGSRAISWYLWFTSIGRTQQVNIWKWGTNFKRSSSISSGEGTGHQYRYLHVTSTVTSWVFHSTLAHVIELNLLRRGLQISAQSIQLMEFRKAPRSMLAARSSSADLLLGSRSNRRVEVTGNW